MYISRMEKLYLVFDMDEAILHYVENDVSSESSSELINDQNENVFEDVIKPGDKLFFRPGFWNFLEYVQSKEGQIEIGMWTFGNKLYATALRPYFDKDKMFEFVFTLENQQENMTNKDLKFVVANRAFESLIPTKRKGSLPKNIFLIDNRPENIYHKDNRNNGIMVESYMGNNDSDTMFERLERICESLLSRGKVPSENLQTFKVGNKKMVIASIGTKFDDGLRPISLKRSRRLTSTSSRMRGGAVTKKKKNKNENKIKTRRLHK